MPLPVAVAAGARMLLQYAGPIVVQCLAFLGLSLVVSEYAMPNMLALLASQLQGAPPVFLQALGYVGADQAISIILSAYIVSAASKIRLKRSAA